MNLTREDLDWAAGQGLISSDQSAKLWQAFSARDDKPRFDAAHALYYFGALLIIGAMSFFMTLGWEWFGGLGIFMIAATYAAAFSFSGHRLWSGLGLKVPGGLLVTVAVCMVPLAIYGLEKFSGIWPQGDPGAYRGYHIWVKGSWFLMEIGTIAAGVVALCFMRFPFITAPIAFTLWYMSMDLTPLLFGKEDFSWQERQWISVWFGFAMIAGSFVIDRKNKRDFAFWGYLFGLMAFWGGLTAMDSDSEWNKFIYCLINVGLMMFSVVIRRRAFMVFGAMGVFGYLSHLAYSIFEDSVLFPFALSLLGIVIIFLGVQYQRHYDAIQSAIDRLLPAAVRDWLPR